jgi:hypothetical protein
MNHDDANYSCIDVESFGYHFNTDSELMCISARFFSFLLVNFIPQVVAAN